MCQSPEVDHPEPLRLELRVYAVSNGRLRAELRTSSLAPIVICQSPEVDHPEPLRLEFRVYAVSHGRLKAELPTSPSSYRDVSEPRGGSSRASSFGVPRLRGFEWPP